MAGGGGNSLHRPTSSTREGKRTLRQGHEEPLPQGNQEYKLWGKELISESKRARTYHQDDCPIYLPDTNKSS